MYHLTIYKNDQIQTTVKFWRNDHKQALEAAKEIIDTHPYYDKDFNNWAHSLEDKSK